MLDDFREDTQHQGGGGDRRNGGKAFVSGADISRFEKERSNEEAVAHYNKVVEEATPPSTSSQSPSSP